MDRTLILKRFKDIGLSSNEAKSYLCLLQRDTLSVPEISKLAGIPPPNAYRSLEKLMSKGLCISKAGPTKKYAASDPSSLKDKFLGQVDEAIKIELESFKEKLQHGLKEKEEEMSQKRKAAKENIKSLITELRPQYEKSRLETNPLDYIQIIKDPYQIHKRFMQLLAQGKEEILVITKPPFSGPREKLEEQVGQGSDTSKRGIRVRCIYEIARDEDERRWQLEMIKRAVSAGEEARVSEELPMKMAIFDSSVVMYWLEDPVSQQTSLTAQVVVHHSLAKGLRMLFETLWELAQDYHILKG
jgi:predicted transcriptional regulator